MVALLLGVFGVLVLALFPHEGLAVVSGVAFYTAGAAAVNVLWMRQFVFSGVREVRRAIVATAVATSVLLPLWWLPDAGALLAAAILFVLSAGAYGLVDKGEMPRHESTCVDAPSMGRGEMFCVSNNTVRSHILHLYAKCDVHSRQELITLIDEWEPAS